MPLAGGYKTFGECVGAQRRKGRSVESARKICGKLEKIAREQASASFVPSEVILDESYSDKVTRIMNEYNIDEAGAVAVVNKLIQDEQSELQKEELDLLRRQLKNGGKKEATS